MHGCRPKNAHLYTLMPEDPAAPLDDWHVYQLEWEADTMRW